MKKGGLYKLKKIESVEYLDEEDEMCDIEVEDVNCYYVDGGVVSHNSKEPVWLEAFQSEEGDPHKNTAIKLFGEENYNRDKRKKAKGMNFGRVA